MKRRGVGSDQAINFKLRVLVFSRLGPEKAIVEYIKPHIREGAAKRIEVFVINKQPHIAAPATSALPCRVRCFLKFTIIMHTRSTRATKPNTPCSDNSRENSV